MRSSAPSSSTAPLRLYYAATFTALGAYLPYFPAWLEARGVRGVEMGAALSLMPALGVVGPLFFGFLADRLGLRGRLLRVACLGAALPFFVLAILGARNVALGFLPLAGLIAMYALFRSPMIMMADVVMLERVKERGDDYGKTRLFGSIAFLVTALVVGDRLDVTKAVGLPLTIATALSVSFLSAWLLPGRSAAPPRPLLDAARTLLARRSMGLFLAISFLGQVAHVSYDILASLHLRDLGASGRFVGVFWAAGVVFEIALMALATRWSIAENAPTWLAVGIAGGVVRWIAFAWLRSPEVLLALQPLHAVSFALVWLASLGYLGKKLEPGVASTAQGLFTAAVGLGSVVGSFAWAPLYREKGGAAVFTGAAVVASAALLLAFLLARRERN